MNWQLVKEFLKPDKRRIAIFVIALFFLLIFFRVSPLGNDYLGYEPSLLDEILGKLWVIAFLINLIPLYLIGWPFSNYPLILIILLIIFWYLISCGIVWIFSNRKKK